MSGPSKVLLLALIALAASCAPRSAAERTWYCDGCARETTEHAGDPAHLCVTPAERTAALRAAQSSEPGWLEDDGTISHEKHIETDTTEDR